jgi:hypothetical protein
MLADVSPRAAQPTSEEQRTPRARELTAPDALTATPHPLLTMLTSRSGLRQAWVLKEKLGLPVARRHAHDDFGV